MLEYFKISPAQRQPKDVLLCRPAIKERQASSLSSNISEQLSHFSDFYWSQQLSYRNVAYIWFL